MTKEVAKLKLHEAQNNLKMAEIILEMHENGVRELREDIEELEELINKPDRWQDKLVQPDKEEYFYLKNNSSKGLAVDWNCETKRKPEHAFKTEEQAELIKEKILLMQEMHAFAHARNEGWVPDWRNGNQVKYGIVSRGARIEVDWFAHDNAFVFGVTVKSKAIAEEMLEIFGNRIEKFYNKIY